MSTLTSLRDVLIEELRDIFNAEKQITKALPKMVRAATSEQLKAGFEKHLEATHGQIERLEQCFELLDVSVRGKTCAAMQGIIEQANDSMKNGMEPDVLDAVLVASAQKVEHYEIAAYGTLMTWAENLNQPDVAKLLSATLDEEKATDVKLTQLATQQINARAAKAAAA